MNGYAKILKVEHLPIRGCWMALVDIGIGPDRRRVLVSGPSQASVKQRIKRQCQITIERKLL